MHNNGDDQSSDFTGKRKVTSVLEIICQANFVEISFRKTYSVKDETTGCRSHLTHKFKKNHLS